jgi:hypothetical protein
MFARRTPVWTLAATLAALASLCTAVRSRGDELKLKDGSKVTGTIVGFEENSFKVKTSYGFAVVLKDQVVSITMSYDAAKSADATTTTLPPTLDAPKPLKIEKPKPAPPAKISTPTPTPAPPVVTESNSTAPRASAAVAAPVPRAKPAAPEPIRESVTGNTYTNETYGFHMYKPPDWKVIEGARSILPGSITAMGTDDQTTYLLIGQDPAGKSLASEVDSTEKRLRDILENFRPIDDKRVTVAGVPAIERHFRGTVDDKDWSGVVVYLPRDTHVYTIFGMTLADTDLVQIQENVIARAIASLQFTQ